MRFCHVAINNISCHAFIKKSYVQDPALEERLEEAEQRMQPGTIKHALFYVSLMQPMPCQIRMELGVHLLCSTAHRHNQSLCNDHLQPCIYIANVNRGKGVLLVVSSSSGRQAQQILHTEATRSWALGARCM